MNILIITQMYSQPDDVGDNKPTKTVNYFAKEWVAAGHNVVVMHCPSKFPVFYYWIPKALKDIVSGRISTMTPSKESRKDLHSDENGINVYRFPMLKFYPGQAYSIGKLMKQSKKISSLIDGIGFKPDVVIGHFANPSTELVSNIAGKYGAKSSIVFHHDCSAASIAKYRIKENVKRIGAIGARSIIEAKQIQVDLGLDKTPFVCYSGAPNDAVIAAEKTCQKMDFSNGVKHIYVGSLIKRKHLDSVIKAFVEQKKPGDTLKVVGGGPEEYNLKKLVTELNAEECVVFTGRVTREEVLKEMKEAQIFTLISDDETYGIVYIEAMLQGCLVIASKNGGFDGIVVDGVNGFICNPGETDMLKCIYDRIVKMPEKERNSIGQNAINTAVHYSEKEVAERYLNNVLCNK
ncbi:glycosyltransferase [Clostridium algidicarnis]|uniref:glycosyltransferase n=1 Tax=Clostridium algidicarnis TaxID=37659 RepID=UPI001629EEFF|nr:glycosyltransferase [Clostridium algidicarnis]MBB6698255.1 glycosyltransferase [Clostridium algidicarnis]